MRFRFILALAGTLLTLSACSGAEEAPSNDGVEPEQPPAIEPVAEIALSDLGQQGERIYLRCQSCHKVEKDGPHLVGPNLNGLIGATAGVKEGYVYSDALAGSGLVWDRETLDQWIEAPQDLVPGNKMVFAGLPNPEDREALIQYLEEATK